MLGTGVLSAAYPSGSGDLALGDESGRIHLFRRGTKVKEFRVASSAIEELGFVDNGTRLIAVAADQKLAFVSVPSGATKSIRYSTDEYRKTVRRVAVP
jgi:hypothetical protein